MIQTHLEISERKKARHQKVTSLFSISPSVCVIQINALDLPLGPVNDADSSSPPGWLQKLGNWESHPEPITSSIQGLGGLGPNQLANTSSECKHMSTGISKGCENFTRNSPWTCVNFQFFQGSLAHRMLIAKQAWYQPLVFLYVAPPRPNHSKAWPSKQFMVQNGTVGTEI